MYVENVKENIYLVGTTCTVLSTFLKHFSLMKTYLCQPAVCEAQLQISRLLVRNKHRRKSDCQKGKQKKM